MQATVIIIHF